MLVAGWNSLNEYAHIASIFSSGNTDLDIYREGSIYERKIINEFKLTQLADDLVQAVMRSQARYIANQNSDCKPATIYLLHPGNQESNEVLRIFNTQFPGARIGTWAPQGIPSNTKLSQPVKNAMAIIKLLDEYKSKGCDEVLWSDLKKNLGFSNSKFTKATHEDYFIKEVASRGYKTKKCIDSRAKKFVI